MNPTLRGGGRDFGRLRLPAAAVALLAAFLLSGCKPLLQPDETPDAETGAAVKTIDKARSESADQGERVKEVDDLTASPTP